QGVPPAERREAGFGRTGDFGVGAKDEVAETELAADHRRALAIEGDVVDGQPAAPASAQGQLGAQDVGRILDAEILLEVERGAEAEVERIEADARVEVRLEEIGAQLESRIDRLRGESRRKGERAHGGDGDERVPAARRGLR